MNKKYVLVFIAGIATSLLVLPLLYALGVPTYDVLLASLFGENKILATGFSLILIIAILFGLVKYTKKYG
ncbi:hypothetical protein [Oceanobacillus sp. CAU 1775]